MSEMTHNSSSEMCEVYVDVLPDPSTNLLVIVIFGIVYSLMFFLGVVGNGLVILLTLRNDSLQTVQNIFILNLAASDLIVCFVSLPITPITSIYKNWYFGVALCHLLPWVQAVSVFICTFSLCAIAVARFILIFHPHANFLTKRNAFIITAVMWTSCIAITLPYVIFIDLISYPGLCGEFCTEIWPYMHIRIAYTVFVMTAQFILPFAIMAVCYWMIFAKIHKRSKERLRRMSERSMLLTFAKFSPYRSPPSSVGRHRPSQISIGSDPEQKQQLKLVSSKTQRTTTILFCMVLIFGLTWLPHNVLSVIYEFDDTFFDFGVDNISLIYLVNLFTHCIAMSNNVANPILYALLNPIFLDILRSNSSRMRNRFGSESK